jgi:replicative DNA helicase
MPFVADSEEAVIGVLLNSDGELVSQARQSLEPDDFYVPAHRSTFRALCEMNEEGVPIDLLSVVQRMENDGRAGKVTAFDIAKMTDTSASTATLDYHINQVAAYSNARRVITLGANWMRRAQKSPSSDLVSSVFTDVKALSNRACKSLGMEDLRAAHEAWLEAGVDSAVLTTDIRQLDEKVKIQSDHLIVIGARPKTGKTALTIDLLARWSRSQGAGLFYSLEMSADRIARRFAARLCDHGAWRRRVSGQDGALSIRELLQDNAEKLYKMPIRIIDNQHDIEGICASIRHEIARDPSIKYIAIDYVEMITSKEKFNGPVETINHALRSLVALKKEIKRPIILVAQLRRRSEEFAGEPSMDELKGSGLIEQSADVILLLWEAPMTDAETQLCNGAYRKIKARLVQRDGPHGVLDLEYYAPQARFVDWRMTGGPK